MVGGGGGQYRPACCTDLRVVQTYVLYRPTCSTDLRVDSQMSVRRDEESTLKDRPTACSTGLINDLEWSVCNPYTLLLICTRCLWNMPATTTGTLHRRMKTIISPRQRSRSLKLVIINGPLCSDSNASPACGPHSCLTGNWSLALQTDVSVRPPQL